MNLSWQKQLATFEIAYQQAIYEIFAETQTIEIRVNVSNADLNQLLQHFQQTTWALITAYNPHSQLLECADNQARHRALAAAVKPLGLPFLSAVGSDPLKQWPSEDSLFIMGITQTDAEAIGKKFSQNAILYGVFGGSPQLLWLWE